MRKQRPQSRLGSLGDQRSVVGLVTKALASALPGLVDEGFQRRSDPEGGPWAPRKDDLPHPLLELTGKMRGTVSTKIEGKRVEVKNDADYLKHHQHGTVKMIARRVAPVGKLPVRWKQELDKAAKAALEELRHGRS